MMNRAMHIATGAVAMLAALVALAGCGISDPPYTHTAGTTRPSHTPSPAGGPAAQQDPGEAPAPPPPSARSQAPNAPAATPVKAIERFALVYVNWSWRTLPAHLRALAAMSVGAARLAEQQAAAAAGRDSEITATHVYNRGQIASIAPSRTQSGEWVIVTREQTGGNAQYDGLQPSWHVTLAQLVHLPTGYAISQWLPQN
jgi:hypothetical protein